MPQLPSDESQSDQSRQLWRETKLHNRLRGQRERAVQDGWKMSNGDHKHDDNVIIIIIVAPPIV